MNVSLHSLSFSRDENRTVLGNASHFLFAPIKATHLNTVGYRVQCKLLHVLMYTSIQEFDPVQGMVVHMCMFVCVCMCVDVCACVCVCECMRACVIILYVL